MLDSGKDARRSYVALPHLAMAMYEGRVANSTTRPAPDALDNLKRAFKGMFKRGKKSNTTTPTTASAEQPPQPSTALEQPAAPQLPPIQTSSPIGSTSDTNKPLPPTHPLATGKREEPVEAVPTNKDAQPGPPAPIVGPAETADQVQEQQKDTTSPISPPEPSSTVDGAHDGDVSAMTNEDSPQSPSPVKVDSGVEESKIEEPAGIYHNFNITFQRLTQTVATSEQTTNDENIQPHAITTTTEEDKPVPNGTAAPDQPAPSEQAEKKVAVMDDEPPPIKPAKPAPGMSATSGPLEDFPEGGDMREV